MVASEAVAEVVTLAFMVAVRSPAVGAFVRFVTVVMVPAVILVVFATVPVGNVAAKNPVGCVYVAMRLLMVASRFDAVRPVTLPTLPLRLPVMLPVTLNVCVPLRENPDFVVMSFTVRPVPSDTPFISDLPTLRAVVKSPAVVSCHTPLAISETASVAKDDALTALGNIIETNTRPNGHIMYPVVLDGFVVQASPTVAIFVAPTYEVMMRA